MVICTLRSQSSAGVVCGKVLTPDGYLQEAGRMLLGDGAAGHRHRWRPEPRRTLLRARVGSAVQGRFWRLRARRSSEWAASTSATRTSITLPPTTARPSAAQAGGVYCQPGRSTSSTFVGQCRWPGTPRKSGPSGQQVGGDDRGRGLEMSRGRLLMCAPHPPEYDWQCGSRRTMDLIEFSQQLGWQVMFVAID